VRLLVVEDEPDLAQALAAGLRREGYAVDLAADGATALERLTITDYDLVCLDLGLPDIDGREVCRRIAAMPADPNGHGVPRRPRVLMLTARDSFDDRVAGLDDGADDYLVKPFSFAELAARLRALARRDVPTSGSVMRVGDIELDAARFIVTRGGARLDLTAKEFALLRYFMLHPDDVLTPERLLEHVWDEQADPFTNTVRVTISNLRRKLAAEGTDAQPIETVVGIGYRLRSGSAA
jgi:two-component system response regulator MprA